MSRLTKLAVLLLLFAGTSAQAAVIYEFTGTCSHGCEGTATGTLTFLTDYAPGGWVGGHFADWSFSSTAGSFDATQLALSGWLPLDAGVGSLLTLAGLGSGGFNLMASFGNGYWSVTYTGRHSWWTVKGNPHTWRRVPEPTTLLLLAAGLIGIGLARRRHKS